MGPQDVFLAGPFRNALILPESHALKIGRLEQVREIAMEIGRGGKARVSLFPELIGEQRLPVDVGIVPPFQDPVAGRAEQPVSWKLVPFLALVDLSRGGKEIPEVAAGPCRPREAVVDIQRRFTEPPATPYASQGSLPDQGEGAIPGQGDIPLRIVPHHAGGDPGIFHRNTVVLRMPLDEPGPLGNDRRFDPDREPAKRGPETRRNPQLSNIEEPFSVES